MIVIKGSWLSRGSKSKERGSDRISYLVWNRAQFQGLNVLTQKWLNGYYTSFSPMIKLGKDTKNCCDGFEVYKGCGYVAVSSTGRNPVKMATFSFKNHQPIVQTGVAEIYSNRLGQSNWPSTALIYLHMCRNLKRVMGGQTGGQTNGWAHEWTRPFLCWWGQTLEKWNDDGIWPSWWLRQWRYRQWWYQFLCRSVSLSCLQTVHFVTLLFDRSASNL